MKCDTFMIGQKIKMQSHTDNIIVVHQPFVLVHNNNKKRESCTLSDPHNYSLSTLPQKN